MTRWLLLCGLVLAACAPPREAKWGYANGAFDRYTVTSIQKTPKGIAFDPSGLPINPLLIDRLVDEVEACLGMSVDRSVFTVKVAADWVPSCGGPSWPAPQELLPVETQDPSGCLAKGLTPTPQCPCRWRAGVKFPNIIVTTPAFYLFKDALLRWLTGVINVWGNLAFAECAAPTTLPLSDGTEP